MVFQIFSLPLQSISDVMETEVGLRIPMKINKLKDKNV